MKANILRAWKQTWLAEDLHAPSAHHVSCETRLHTSEWAHAKLLWGHPGGSAFAGYQPFSPNGPAPQLTSLMHQHSAPVPRGEEDAVDEEVQINNRAAGGAGKRLSVEDLQVDTFIFTSAARCTGLRPGVDSTVFVHQICPSLLLIFLVLLVRCCFPREEDVAAVLLGL